MKIKTVILLLLAIVMVSFGCSPEDPSLGDNQEDTLEIVDNVPSELFHWLSPGRTFAAPIPGICA